MDQILPVYGKNAPRIQILLQLRFAGISGHVFAATESGNGGRAPARHHARAGTLSPSLRRLRSPCFFRYPHDARPVHLIITTIKRIRTSRLSIKNSLSLFRWVPSRLPAAFLEDRAHGDLSAPREVCHPATQVAPIPEGFPAHVLLVTPRLSQSRPPGTPTPAILPHRWRRSPGRILAMKLSWQDKFAIEVHRPAPPVRIDWCLASFTLWGIRGSSSTI